MTLFEPKENAFNRMTIVAATEVIADFQSHSDMSVLEVQWDIQKFSSSSSKSARVASWAQVAADIKPQVMTEVGIVPLERALVEKAIQAPDNTKQKPDWKKLLAGLRFDGFEVVEEEREVEGENLWGDPKTQKFSALVRMLPTNIPGLDFREAENEIVTLLDRHSFSVAKGHLRQAVSAFQRGEWSSANGELRNFYESYLNEIATSLGFIGSGDSKAKRDFLGQNDFLLSDYNEWNANNQKPQYVQGLLSRMHPHGGHPGLSEEEDATFRLQISLVTARLFLRRFNQRKTF
ncbi:hypothetical protein [uncultured Sulfitobacter sp.]|uniref:hypothetical protein n=1 Tax=uncultured Sulfitobacter sp. TaxID=191468 RepID=UPI002621839A|nr:hypothetical protein [uncultured Sulfitobacter sp.]